MRRRGRFCVPGAVGLCLLLGGCRSAAPSNSRSGSGAILAHFPPATLWLAFVVVIVWLGGVALYNFAPDRRRRRFDVTEPELRAAFAVVTKVSLAKKPIDVAADAIRAVGGRDISTSEDASRVVGWIGKTLTNIPQRQEYRLLIDIRPASSGYEFRCLAQARFASALLGAARARDLAQSLSEEIAAHPQTI